MYLVGSIALIAIIAGCSYNHKNFDQSESPLNGSDNYVLQFDDYGQLWDRKPATEAIAKIRSLSQKTNVVVLLFVHGWNHNASSNSRNVIDFADSLAKTRDLLLNPHNPESKLYRSSRFNLTGTEDVSVVGIYVGWRGKSLPGIFNYTTFWGRKAAAERVGRGDLREFMFELNTIYKDAKTQRTKGLTKNFMGLASIGHSFGGQVLFKSVADEIENELILATKKTSTQIAEKKGTYLNGFGDLIVLVNPAMEAMQFERIHRLSNKLIYSKQQSPILLVVSSAGDLPRQVLFPIGRNLDALFRPSFRNGQRSLWTEALGEYEPFRTHMLDILSIKTAKPQLNADTYLENPCEIATFDLSNVPALANVRLTPTSQHSPNNPFLIAYASTKVVLNHHDVFEKTLRQFLNDYIALAQGKNMLAGDPKLHCE